MLWIAMGGDHESQNEALAEQHDKLWSMHIPVHSFSFSCWT